MSILDDDFEEQADEIIKNLFLYCGDLLYICYTDARNIKNNPDLRAALGEMGRIVGPLNPTDKQQELDFIRDYSDIIADLNEDRILTQLGIREITAVECAMGKKYDFSFQDGVNTIQVRLTIRLSSGAITKMRIIFGIANKNNLPTE